MEKFQKSNSNITNFSSNTPNNSINKQKPKTYKSQYFQKIIERELRTFKNPSSIYSEGSIYRYKP